MFLHSHKRTVKRTHANMGPNLRTETVSSANHHQCSTPSHGPPSPLFLFSRFLFIWSICVCFSEFVSEFMCLGASGSFWAGVWSCVLSSIANKPSVTSVCLWLGFGLLLLTLFSTGFLFISRCCFIISTFTLTDRYSQHFLHRKCLSLFALTLFWAALMCSCRRKMHYIDQKWPWRHL